MTMTKLTKSDGQPLFVSPETILVLETSSKNEAKGEPAHKSGILVEVGFNSGTGQPMLQYHKLNIPMSRMVKIFPLPRLVSISVIQDDPTMDKDMLVPQDWIKSIGGLGEHPKAKAQIVVAFPSGSNIWNVAEDAEALMESIEAAKTAMSGPRMIPTMPEQVEIPDGVLSDIMKGPDNGNSKSTKPVRQNPKPRGRSRAANEAK